MDPDDQPLKKKKKINARASSSQADVEKRMQMEFSRKKVDVHSKVKLQATISKLIAVTS